MTDVLLRHFPPGGNIEYINGQVTLHDGLETAIYLSLFGGNERDSGIEADDHLQWWANLSEPDADRIYRSAFQNLIRSLPLIPANLRRMEDAAILDLTWLVDAAGATYISAVASIPALNRVLLTIIIVVSGERFEFEFSAPQVQA